MQFRKHISGLLACLLLLSNSGFAFSIHYCGGQIAAITSVFETEEVCQMPVPEEKSCCAADTDDHKSCCEDKIVDLEKSQDTIIKNFSFEINSPFTLPAGQLFFVTKVVEVTPSSEATYFPDSHSPPLFQLYSQYIFYA